MIATSNSKALQDQLSLFANPSALENAVLKGALQYQVPAFSRSSLIASLQSSKAQLNVSPSINSRVAQLLELEALASRTTQPSPWLLNSIIANQFQRQASPSLLQLQLQGAKEGLNAPTGLDFLRSVNAAAPSAASVLKKPEVERTSHINTILVASSGKRQYIDDAAKADVLCGRGGRSNHHPGNKRYRQVVSEMKASYRSIGSKSAKTDLSRAIVDHVYKYGGRFLKTELGTGKYYILTPAEARKKTSQALREAKDVKWTV
jgi:hypothetical protein